jgi:hypothetical protein
MYGGNMAFVLNIKPGEYYELREGIVIRNTAPRTAELVILTPAEIKSKNINITKKVTPNEKPIK